MPKLPWFEDADDDDDGSDPADWWKPREHKWEFLEDPDSAFNKEFTNTVFEKTEAQLWRFKAELARNWRGMANMFHAAAKTPYEAFHEKITEPPALLVNIPELFLCTRASDCGKHLRNKPAYIPEEKTIHITPNCARRMKNVITGLPYQDEPMPFYIDDCMGRAIHHQLNPQVFEPRKQFSLEDLEARTLIGCVERIARLAHNPVDPRELPKIYKFETDRIKKYAKALRKKPLAEVSGTIRGSHRAELFRHGFGRVYANDLYHLNEKSCIDDETIYFGDGGVASPAGVMRVIARAQDLTEAAELLFQKAEGPKAEYFTAKLWSRARTFYGAVAYNLIIMHNFFEKAASKQQS